MESGGLGGEEGQNTVDVGGVAPPQSAQVLDRPVQTHTIARQGPGAALSVVLYIKEETVYEFFVPQVVEGDGAPANPPHIIKEH